ncbi:Protein-associating with the carboxyl-terminal domain of ezrin [Myotis brandtii]|uniref:Protein-associating with the carboxyl-terminal domain of ezrin n=1 Tax=Myotis brandtii TaxID=109478 RepID=S7MH18_MYOBR|nr:Protein-associating with the carboxyl-terminal domain of ezrin [Myotis brandtii]
MEKLEVTIASSSRCRPHKERGSHHLIDIGCDMALQVVLQNLLKCVILFYTVYYVVLSLGCRALSPAELQDGRVTWVFVYKRENEDKANKATRQAAWPPKDVGPRETPRLLARALFRSGWPRAAAAASGAGGACGQSHLEAYWEHCSAQQLRIVLPPQVFLGLRDSSSSIWQSLLLSLACWSPYLDQRWLWEDREPKSSNALSQVLQKRLTFPQKVKRCWCVGSSRNLSCDSPTHLICSQHRQTSPALENRSGVFSKDDFSGDRPISNKKQEQQDSYTTLSRAGGNSDRFSQPRPFPMNGLSDVKNISGDSENLLPSPQASEE